MRVWVGVDADGLRRLRDGGALGGEVVAAESDDEQHEYEALVAAAEDGASTLAAPNPASHPSTPLPADRLAGGGLRAPRLLKDSQKEEEAAAAGSPVPPVGPP